MLTIKDLKATINEKSILNGLDLNIKPGQIQVTSKTFETEKVLKK